jgi:hypothetical protein
MLPNRMYAQTECHCWASMTITGSLANTTYIVEKTVIVNMAESGASMKEPQTCIKPYFMRDQLVKIVTVTTPALYAKNIHRVLLSGKTCDRVGIRIILNADPDIAGLYPLDADKQSHNGSHKKINLIHSRANRALSPEKGKNGSEEIPRTQRI